MLNIQKSGIDNAYKVTANIIGVDEYLFNKYNGGGGYSRDDENDYERYIAEMEKAKYDIEINDYLISLQTNPFKGSTVASLGIVVAIVCGIIVFTSVFCIKNSFDISITEKIRQYGMLRSIGATKKQIRKNVFYEASILGAIGIPLGIIFGFLASFVLIAISNGLLINMLIENVKLKFYFSWSSVIIAILLGILTIYLSAFRSARRAAKISPIESIRNSGNIKIKNKKVKGSKIIYKIFGMGGNISYKNLKRNKKRYRTTVISIAVSVLIFVSLSSFMSMAFSSVEKELNMRDYNLSVQVLSTKSKETKELAYEKAKTLGNLDIVENYTIHRSTGFNLSNPKYNQEYVKLLSLNEEETKSGYTNICALGEEQYQKYITSLGLKYEDVKEKGIFISCVEFARVENGKSKTYRMKELNYQKGDVLHGVVGNSISSEDESEEEMSVEIACATEQRPFGFKNYGYRNMLIVSDELFEKNCSTDYIEIYYKTTDANRLQDMVEEEYKDMECYTNNIAENTKEMSNLFTIIGIFLYGFITVISLIGITNIFNTITTSVQLRKQEFAMLKSIGITTKEFNKMISLESIFMGVKSLIVGIAIGIGLSYLMYHYFAEYDGLPYRLPLLAIFICIVAVFLLISLIMKYSVNKINKQNIIETIRNENI